MYISLFLFHLLECVQQFFDAVEKQTLKKKKGKDIYLQLIKKRSKVHEKNMLNNRSLNLDQ